MKKNIIVTTDFSDSTGKGLDYACELAKDGEKLTIQLTTLINLKFIPFASK